MLTFHQKVKLIGFSFGILVFFTIFGLLQERIFKWSYGDAIGLDGKKSEMFTYSVGFTAILSIAYALFAKGFLIVSRNESKVETESIYYFLIGIFITIASVTANMALEHISYPTQVIAKSSKPIPVMLLGVMIGKKSYSPQKYIFVLMIIVAVITFLYNDKPDKSGANLMLGNFLIGLSLLADGLAGAFQDRMRSFSKPSSMDFMYNVCGWSSVILIAVLAVTGEGREMILFIQRHPSIFWQLGLTVLSGTGGVIFISLMITSFGSLPCSIVTTLRKFFTILLSVVVNHNVLSLQQWIATVVLFFVLMLDSYLSKSSTLKAESIPQDEEATASLEEENDQTVIMEQEKYK